MTRAEKIQTLKQAVAILKEDYNYPESKCEEKAEDCAQCQGDTAIEILEEFIRIDEAIQWEDDNPVDIRRLYKDERGMGGGGYF
jgi:hypothetical protein